MIAIITKKEELYGKFIPVTKETNEAVQKHLFSLGFKFRYNKTKILVLPASGYDCIKCYGDGKLDCCTERYMPVICMVTWQELLAKYKVGDIISCGSISGPIVGIGLVKNIALNDVVVYTIEEPTTKYQTKINEYHIFAVSKLQDKPFTESFYMKQNIEVETMEMKIEDIKVENLKAAKEQFDAERKNMEIEFAKQKLRDAVDEVDAFDRDIKALEEQKKPYLDIIKKFG